MAVEPSTKTRAQKLVMLRQCLAGNKRNGRDSAEGLTLGENELGCTLRRGALHEVYARDASFGSAASGFAASLASRLSDRKPLFWISSDYASLEYGTLNGAGLLEFGIDPARVILLKLARGEDALRAAIDILACAYAGAVILEVAGPLKALDFKASRRLALAAEDRNVTAIVLRLGAEPEASAAETRWLIHAAASPPARDGDWGRPAFDACLLRNRRGGLGQWRIEWDCEHGFSGHRSDHAFPAHPVGLAPVPADGSLAA